MFLYLLIALLRAKGKLRKQPTLQLDDVRSILIVELTRLGDVVTMLPAVRLLADRFPQARITLLVDEQYGAFVSGLGLQCEVLGARKPESAIGFFRVFLKVRKLGADLALSMSPPKRNAAVALASGAKAKVGYLTYRHTLTPYLETTPVEAYGWPQSRSAEYGRENIEKRSLKVCYALGIEPADRDLGVHIRLDTDWVHERRQQLLADGSIAGRRFVVIHPFSGWEYRSWPLGRFGDIANIIVERLNHDVIFLCEKSEEKKLSPVQQRFAGRKDVRFLASGDLLDTCVVLKEAALFVGNDSGPLHVASALGTPVVGLFGPASPELTGPRNTRAILLFKKVECSPCSQLRCERPDASCMTLMSTDEVMHAVMKTLSLVPETKAAANA